MKPIVDGLEAEFAGQVAVIRLNAGVTAERELAAGYGLRSHPSFAVVDAAGEVQHFIGPQPAGTLRAAMAAAQD
jgi:thioredoxin-like negative regulator of GroEL